VAYFKPYKTKKTSAFYDDLMAEKRNRVIWGKKRFDASKSQESISIQKYFKTPVSTLVKTEDVVLDLGCGAGIFLPVIAPLCARLIGIDVSSTFVKYSKQIIEKNDILNASAIKASSGNIPFKDNSFDSIIIVDVLHHLRHIDETLKDVRRILKPGGRLIIYEPNKLNFVLYLMCLIDRNEWGLLSLGRMGIYKRLLEKYFSIDRMVYNGLLIGPDSKLNLAIADLLEKPAVKFFLGWLSPKILITLSNHKKG